MITADDYFAGPPRITRADFKAIIERDAAPSVSAERDPGAYYDVIAATGVDPLFLLAMFNHESSLGEAGMATKTFSWGNTRPPSFGVPQLGVINGFSSYRDWLDGCKSTASRLVDVNWVYNGRTSIRELFVHPSGEVWAPAGDNNDPAGYLRAVLDYMNAHASTSTPSDATYGPTSVPTVADGFVSVDVLWAADTGAQRPLSDIKWAVVHKTEGNRAGDLPTLTAKDGNLASAHAWISRDGQVVWMVPLNVTAWTAGNEFVNDHSINFELEGGEDEATTDAQYAALAGLLRFARKCGVTVPWEYVGKDERPGLIGHYDVGNPDWPHPGACGQWGGRSCHHDPGPLFDWPKLIAYLNSTSAPESTNVPPNATPSTNVPTVVLGFKGFYDGLGDKALRVLGLPLVNEFGWTDGGKQHSAQKFERGWLLWVPEHGSPWDIVVAPLVTIPELEARLAALGA